MGWLGHVQPGQTGGHLPEVSLICVVYLLSDKQELPNSLSCHGTSSHLARASPSFFPLNLYYLSSQTSRTVSEVLGSNCAYFVTFSSLNWRPTLNAGKSCFGDTKPLEEIVGFKKNQTSLWGYVFQSFFFLLLSPILIFVGFHLNFSSLPWSINSTDILY